MSVRRRHCVECPGCHTWYLVAFTPYKNGSYLVRTAHGANEEYTLYCFCEGAALPPRSWKWCTTRSCEVSKQAHHRGYGSPQEVWPVREQSPGASVGDDLARYL